MHVIKVGVLPLYLELYDRVFPTMRETFVPLLSDIKEQFEARGFGVHVETICRTRDETGAAVRRLEDASVDVLAVVHLAYSPSLESIDALTGTPLPILLLDTTMDGAFGNATDAERIQFNHGIHGVQDLASVLIRRKRPFRVVAGHVKSPPLFDHAAMYIRAAASAAALRHMQVLRVGESFRGMGDFFVDESVLHAALGVRVIQVDTTPVAQAAGSLPDAAIRHEMEIDRRRYSVAAPEPVHRRSVQASLALREVTESAGCGACSFNFLAFDSNVEPLATPPFLGASKMMAEGFGYAGEGDVLTAALVGALNRSFPVNFTEMFCPDWDGGSIFLSHMGEFNPACAEGPVHMVEKDFPFTGALNPAILVGAMRRGPAVLVNLAPGPDDGFSLLAAPVEVLPDAKHPTMQSIVRGWIRPPLPIEAFLEWYSSHGGTHHGALVYDAGLDALRAFADYCGIPCVTPHAPKE